MITQGPVSNFAAALLLTIVVAGCGSTEGSSSVSSQSATRTQDATTTRATKDSTDPPSESTSVGNSQIDVGDGGKVGVAAYLRSITPIRRELVKVHTSTSAMAAAIKAGDAPTAGRNAMAAAAGVRRALAIARTIRPHRQPLATVHTQLMANLAIGAAYLNQMSRDLNAADVAAIRRWKETVVPKVRRSERWYREWAANVAAFGTVDNVKAPHWLFTMDRWN